MSVREHITGVGHVGIPTNDLEGTIAYYEKLGFESEQSHTGGVDHGSAGERDRRDQSFRT